MSDDLLDALSKIPANDQSELHHLILVALSQYHGLHKFKAGVLFMEAMAEMKSAIDAGEFTDKAQAAHAFVIGCEALANEAAIYLSPPKN